MSAPATLQESASTGTGQTYDHGSYGQIVKVSALVGGAQFSNILVGMLRTKGVALLLGAAGVGEVGLFTSLSQLVASLSGMGIGSSAVREVADAGNSNDALRLSKTAHVLRRVCWATGLVGWGVCIAFSIPLSKFMFGSSDRAFSIACLGAAVFFGQLSAGQSALIRGSRRIGDFARQSILAAINSTWVSLVIYYFFGAKGIIPVFIAASIAAMIVSWWFASRIPLQRAAISWRETIVASKQMVALGAAFMIAEVCTNGATWTIQSIIHREIGATGNGIYTSAWTLSGQFAVFILAAMGADFYPRLAASSSDQDAMNRIVNEQTEIGVLLALPGLLATLSLAPWMLRLFYSKEFLPGAELLPWFVIGVFIRVVQWPMGFVQLALAKGGVFMATQALLNFLHVGLVYFAIQYFGVKGAAIAFAGTHVVAVILIRVVAGRLIGFHWSPLVRKLLLESVALVGASFLLLQFLPEICGEGIALLLAAVATIYCVRGLTSRLGRNHRITRLASQIPWLIPKATNTPA